MITTVEKEISGLTPTRGTIISIGVFDGLHLGHQTLVGRLVKQAREKELISVVITFRQHPMALLSPGEPVPSITSLTERIRLLKEEGVDIVIPLTFSHELANMGAQPFVLMLQRYLKMQGMILGWDFALGKHREGSLETLQELGTKLGFSTEIVGPVKLEERLSPAQLSDRRWLQETSPNQCHAGTPVQSGRKCHTGDGRGATLLGFPTANLDLAPAQALPADGVYAARACFDNHSGPAAVFIGLRPTFDGTNRIVEVQILDFTGDLYRRNLKIDIIERLRGVVKFPDAETLKAQIEKDITRVRRILSQP
jgi:riboflavin kinase/FMN adenylyltransferase